MTRGEGTVLASFSPLPDLSKGVLAAKFLNLTGPRPAKMILEQDVDHQSWPQGKQKQEKQSRSSLVGQTSEEQTAEQCPPGQSCQCRCTSSSTRSGGTMPTTARLVTPGANSRA